MDITVLNTSFENIAVIDQFESLIWTQRYQQYGDFELYLPADRRLFSILSIDNYLCIPDSDCVMIIEGLELQTDDENGDHLIVTGRSLESLLSRRIVWPPTFVKGGVQSVVKTLVENNLGRFAYGDRKVSNLFFVESFDEAITSLPSYKAQYTGDSLYDAIRSICECYNLGFKITLFGNNFEFSLYSGLDRTFSQSTNDPVVFSPEYDTFFSSDYKYSTESMKTVAFVVGEGEGFNQAWWNSNTGLLRREMFVDASDISSVEYDDPMTDAEYSILLAYRGIEKLKETNSNTEFNARPTIGHGYEFRKDYYVGDIVEAVNAYGIGGVCRISEVTISVSSDGYRIYPTFSTSALKEMM